MLYQSLKPVARIALAWYYRSITVSGAERVPRDGPVFLAVNHPNALVDALVVAAFTPRRVRFTAKSTIFANPLVAAFLRRAGVVPLRRASDEASGVRPVSSGSQYPVLDISPEHGAQYPVLDTPAVSSNTSRVPDPSRNASTFEAVANALAEGGAIVIFPEGKSHDAPQLAPLRTGLARMVQMAQHERGVRGIRIVPVGLLFERKEEPRSRVLVQTGDPIDVDAFAGGHATVAELTDEVTARLATVTVNFDTAADAERIQLIGDTLGALMVPLRELSDDAVPLSDTLALVRRIDRAERALAGNERVPQFEQRLRAFRARLSAARIDVHDVAIEVHVAPAITFTLRETAIAAALLPFVAWGRLTHIVPLRLARTVAMRGVQNRDEPAMRTLVVGVLVVLASYAIETAAVALLAGGWWALLFFASLIPSATADFRYSDRLRRARARARAYFRFRRDPGLRNELLAEAAWLREEAGALEALATAN